MSLSLGNAVYEGLCSRGAVVSTDWLSQCISYLVGLGSISGSTKVPAVIDTVLRILLDSDLHVAMDDVDLIPENIQELHLMRLFVHQPRILQIDEVTDVGSAGQRQQLQLSGGALGAGDVVNPAGEEKDEEEIAADRRAAAAGFQGPRHMLKVYLTDGVNKVVALDTQGALAASYQQRCANVGRGAPVPSLHAFYAGAKLSVRNVLVRRGAFVLTKETMVFLGGSVHRLQALDSHSSNNNTSNTDLIVDNNQGVPAVNRNVSSLPDTAAAAVNVNTLLLSVQDRAASTPSSSILAQNAVSMLSPNITAHAPRAVQITAVYSTNASHGSEVVHPVASSHFSFAPPHQQQQQHKLPLPATSVLPTAVSVVYGQTHSSFAPGPHASTDMPSVAALPSENLDNLLPRALSPGFASSFAERRPEMCDDEHTLDGNNSEEEEEDEDEWHEAMEEDKKELEEDKKDNERSMRRDEERMVFVVDQTVAASSSSDVGNVPQEMDVIVEDQVNSGAAAPARAGDYPCEEDMFVTESVDIYNSSSRHPPHLEGATSLSFDAFYDDVPFTNDAPLLTCDLTLSPSPNPFPSPMPSPPVSPKEQEPEQKRSVPESFNNETEKASSLRLSRDPAHTYTNIIAPASDVSRPSRPIHLDEPTPLQPQAQTPNQAQHRTDGGVRLSYWDEHIHPAPAPAGGRSHGHQSKQQSSDVFLVRCIASRVTRLKTVDGGPAGAGSRVFQVHMEVDDGHNFQPCEVSDSLVERFLDMSAADHQALMGQLTSKQEKRQAQIGLMHRFQHFHGLFWACHRPAESQTGDEGEEEGPTVVLIDFALDQVNNVCASLLARMQ